MSHKSAEGFTPVQQKDLDIFLTISKTYLQGAERLANLNAEAIHEALSKTNKLTNRLAQLKTPTDIQAFQNNAAIGIMTKAIEYSRAAFEIMTQTQTEIGKLQFNAIKGNMGKISGMESWNAWENPMVTPWIKATMQASEALQAIIPPIPAAQPA